MEKAKVYFTDFRVKVGTPQTEKLKRLCIAAGFKNIDMEGKFVAIKMHFGELGNLAYLRPQYAKAVADSVAKMEADEQGGKDPASVAQVVLKLIEKKDPPVRVAVGFEYKALMFVLRFLPDRLKQFILRKMYLPTTPGAK